MTATREPVYAAWIDGQATWVVGLDPAEAGAMQSDGIPGADLTMLNKLNYSIAALGDAWPGRALRDYGPSSQHNGLVHHAFADGHAQSLDENIDPSVYYRYITRSSGDGGTDCGGVVAPGDD